MCTYIKIDRKTHTVHPNFGIHKVDTYIDTHAYTYRYAVATISRLLNIIGLYLQNIVSFIGLFCTRDL